jgi:regulator of RNase E activity RraA
MLLADVLKNEEYCYGESMYRYAKKREIVTIIIYGFVVCLVTSNNET